MSASAETFARTSRCIAIAVLLATAPPLPAQDDPPVLHVSNNAVHNGTGCGPPERPCRSISQAIANAEAGSLIEVGPGIYGDIDGDGDATGVGEEDPEPFAAVVLIRKPVTVYSKAGAAQTVIRSPLTALRAVVWIDADSVTLGRPNGGFTIVGTGSEPMAESQGVEVDGANVTIAGNIVTDNNRGGFIVDTGAGDINVLGNVATRNEFGFVVVGASFGVGRVRVEGNIAADNESFGITVGTFGPAVVMNNLATRNRTGFAIFLHGGLTDFTGNVAVANTQFGIESRLSGELIGNAVIGNGIAGFRLFRILEDSCSVHVTRNNIFGNGEAATGCGMINEGCFVVATDNYWGKPNGPGPNPGDRAHKDCAVGGNPITIPFSPIPFPIEGLSGD